MRKIPLAMVKIMPELALGPPATSVRAASTPAVNADLCHLPPGETHQLVVLVVVLVSVFNPAAQFRFCRELSRDAPGVKSIVKIAHRLPGAYCIVQLCVHSNVVAIMPQKAGA